MDRFSKFFTFEELTDSENHPTMVEANRTDALEKAKYPKPDRVDYAL